MADQWIVINHSLWRKPCALVGMRNGEVVGFIPLHDPRDFNWDGKVSVSEWLVSHMPIFGNLSVEGERGEILREIALDSRVLDVNLYAEGTRVIVNAAFVAVREAISTIYINRIAGAAATLALSGTSLSEVAYFFAKQGMQRIFREMIETAAGMN